MQFELSTSLHQDFAASSWLQDAITCGIGAEEQQLSWASTTSSFRSWALVTRPTLPAPQLADVVSTQSFPACPHKDLLCLARHLQQSLNSAGNSSFAAEDQVPIAKAVSEPLLQLATALGMQLPAAAAAAVSLRQQQAPKPHATEAHLTTAATESRSPNKPQGVPVTQSQCQQGRAASHSLDAAGPDRKSAAAEAVAAASEAAVAHEEELKVMLFWLCHLTMAFHQFILQPMAATAGPPSRTKRSGSLSGHHYQQQQQKWLQKTLPTILQQLGSCYRAVAGQQASAMAGCSSSVCSAEPVPVFSRHKDRTAADKLLLATCFSILSTAGPGNSKVPPKPLGSNRSNNNSNAAPQLPALCLQLCAAMFSCHVLFKHQQQLQQLSRQQHQSQLTAEIRRILQDSQQHAPQHRSMLVSALTGLVTDAFTMQQGIQVLCSIAEAVFAPTEAALQPKQRTTTTRKQRQQPQQQEQSSAAALEAAAGAAASDPSAVVLLGLLVDVLQQLSADSTGDCCQQVRLLAAAVLPTLLPAAVMRSNPHARKLYLAIASVAAAAGVTLNTAAAVVEGVASSATSSAGPAQSTAAAAVHAHVSGLAVLTAAASGDRDANVRNKALGLLQEAVPTLWQHLVYWRQQQQQRQDMNGLTSADAAAQPGSGCLTTPALAQVHSSLDAVISTLEQQLLSSSKSCRTKALQLLQELLCNPVEIAAAVLQQPATAAAKRSAASIVRQQQQQIAVRTYPSISVLLDAPQHSAMHCPASKVAAGLLLPQMAALLQPQQVLQLVLSHSSTAGSSNAAGQLLGGLSKCSAPALYQVLRQQLLQPQNPAATSTDTTAAAHGSIQGEETSEPASMLQQQQQHKHRLGVLKKLQRVLSSGGCGREELRCQAFLQVVQTQAAAVAATDIKDSDVLCEGDQGSAVDHQQQQQQQQLLYQLQQDLMLSVQLLELAGGCGAQQGNLRDLRAELAILTDTLDICCYWMQQIQAAAAAEDAGHPVAREAEDVVAAAVTSIVANIMRAAAAAGASEDKVQQQQQHEEEEEQLQGTSNLNVLGVQYLICEQLLGSIVRILGTAAAAGTADVSGPETYAKTASGVAVDSNACTVGSKQHRKLWSRTAASLTYHLDFLLSAVARSPAPSAADARIHAVAADQAVEGLQKQKQLPALQLSETLGSYIQVMCAANSSNSMALHELLLTWHKDLLTWWVNHTDVADSSNAESDLDHASATSAAAAKMQAKLAAFLLLLQHLAGFYKLEQQRFEKRLLATLQGPAAAEAAGDAAATSAAGASQQQQQRDAGIPSSNSRPSKRRNAATSDGSSLGAQQQKHNGTDDPTDQGFDYMMAEEARQCVEASTEEFMTGLMAETAPACYLPLLLQLLQSAETPEHIKVLALQALQPLLLCSNTLSGQHSMLIAALLADPSTPAAVQLQAVATAGELIAAAPAQSQQLVRQLERLLLEGLDHQTLDEPSVAASAVESQAVGKQSSRCDVMGAAAVGSQPPTQAVGACHSRPHVLRAAVVGMRAAGQHSSRSDVLSAAAGVYAVLLLHEKLLLAAASWSVMAAGLLAPKQLQAVTLTMQQLLQYLFTQQRLPCSKAAIGLLMNCPAPTAATPAYTTSNSSNSSNMLQPDSATGRSATGGVNTTTRAAQLIQQHLLGFLGPKDLASDNMQLPLLSALAQAAAAGGWGSQGAAEPAAVLLAACSPSARGLETLLSVVQAHKNAISQPSSAATLAHLQTYTSKDKTAASRARAAAVSRRSGDADEDADQAAAAAAGGSGSAGGVATQAKLQALLAEVSAVAAAATALAAGGKRGAASKRKAAAAARQQQMRVKVSSAAAAVRTDAASLTAAAAASLEDAGTGRVAAAQREEGTKQQHNLVQRLLADRQLALQQYRAKRHGAG